MASAVDTTRGGARVAPTKEGDLVRSLLGRARLEWRGVRIER
jgi:hypothetical protein